MVWLIPLLRGEDRPPAVTIGAMAAWLIVLVAVAGGWQRRGVTRRPAATRGRDGPASAVGERAPDTASRVCPSPRELHDVSASSLSMINVHLRWRWNCSNEQPERAGPRAGPIRRCQQVKRFRMFIHWLTALRAERCDSPRRPPPGIADWTAWSGRRARRG